jgi:hypothetical protein
MEKGHTVSLVGRIFNIRIYYSEHCLAVLPQLRPAPPIDFIPHVLRGSRCVLFSILHQHSACRYISSDSFASCAFHFLSSTVLSIPSKAQRIPHIRRLNFTFGAYIGNLILAPLAIKDCHSHHNNIIIRPPTCACRLHVA